MTENNIVDTRYTHQLCVLIPTQIKDMMGHKAAMVNTALKQFLPGEDGVVVSTKEDWAVFCQLLKIFERNAANLTLTEDDISQFESFATLLTAIDHELSFIQEPLNSRLCARIKNELWAMLEDINEKRRSAVITQALIESLPDDYHLPLIYSKEYGLLMGMLQMFTDQAENLVLRKKDLKTFERYTKILNHYKELLNYE